MTGDTWLVIPMYNEASVVSTVVKDASRLFDHIVCVDDGSTDASAVLAAEAGAVVVRHPVNLGQGAALQTGVEYACRDPAMRFVVTFDADGQHRPEDAVAMMEVLRADEVDIVFGSRFLDSQSAVPVSRTVVLKLAAAYTSLVTRVRLTDTHNGLRAFTRTVAERLDIRHNGMAHASEIVSFVGAQGFRYAELPVHIVYSDYARSKGQSLLNSVNILTDMVIGR